MPIEPANPPAPLSARITAILSVTFTILYVLPFYLSPLTRPSPTISRDAPSVIRARIRYVTCSVIFTTIATIYILSSRAHASPFEVLHLLGWYPISILDITRVLLLTGLLFFGPVFERGVVESGWRDWIRGRSLHETLRSWIGWRNYVASPITEELLFRSLLVPLHLLSDLAPARLILLTPLYFGIAHIHHFYEYSLTHPHTPLFPALVRSLVQFAYTTVFGWYATFLFLRTANLPAVVLAHSYCNWCGLPRLWGRVGDDDDFDRRKPHGKSKGLGIGWTVTYYTLLLAGAIGFGRGLWPLTESKHALATVG